MVQFMIIEIIYNNNPQTSIKTLKLVRTSKQSSHGSKNNLFFSVQQHLTPEENFLPASEMNPAGPTGLQQAPLHSDLMFLQNIQH